MAIFKCVCSRICSKVVGSQARILYSNEEGRVRIALAFNKAIGEGRLKVKTVTHCVLSGISVCYLRVQLC